jgi:hypothetical protein
MHRGIAHSVAAWAALLSASGWHPAFAADPIPQILVGESQLWINNAYWLDDKTLVFSGAESDLPDNAETTGSLAPGYVQFPGSKAHLYTWTMGEQPRVYRPETWPPPGSQYFQNYFCAADGIITYSQEPFTGKGPSQWPVVSGPLGMEAPSGVMEQHGELGWSLINSSANGIGKRCDQYNAPWIAEKSHPWSISYDRALILDRGKREFEPWKYAPVNPKPERPFTLVRLPDRKETPVIGVDPHWASCVQTPSWERTFVAWTCSSGSDDEKVKQLPIWKIHADGHATRTDFAPGQLGMLDLIPFRDGYDFIAYGTYERGFSDAGLYAIAQGKPKRLLAGRFKSLALSPNGCLDAMSDENSFEFDGTREHVIILDLCAAANPKAAPAILAEMKPRPPDPELPERTDLALRYISASDEGPGMSRLINRMSEVVVPGGKNGADIITETDRKMAIAVAKVLSRDDLLYLVAFYESTPYRAFRAYTWASAAKIISDTIHKQGPKVLAPPAISAGDQAVVDAFEKAPRTVAINAKLKRVRDKLMDLYFASEAAISRRQQDLMCSQPGANCTPPTPAP